LPHGYDKTALGTVADMRWLLLMLVAVAVVAVVGGVLGARGRRRAQALADAREEAQRWYERLGGQVMNLSPGDDAAARQALADAGERYNAAGGQLGRATSVRQYELARETALEGLAYARAARVALGLDPGPELPPLGAQQSAGAVTAPRAVDVKGHQYRMSPQPARDTPYYHPGGVIAGRPVPRGWYSEPWWRTALVAGAWGLGSVLVFDALFDGFDGFGDGFDGIGDVAAQGWAGDAGQDFGGGDVAYTGGGDLGGGGDFGGGDFGGF
jgi:uncharacterized membrane protein YgcG